MAVDRQLVKYGGVTLPMCSLSYSGQSRYDDSGQILQGYVMTFRGRTIITATDRDTFVTNYTTVQQALNLTRRRFEWTIGATIIWSVGPAGDSGADYEDRAVGPLPKITSNKQITNGYSAVIEFEIEVFVVFGNNLLDLDEFWWRFEYSYDRNFMCTRTITGQYRIRGGLNVSSELLPRGDCWPALPETFHRNSWSYSTSPDGRTLSFHIQDRQNYRTLPRPITNGDATMRFETRGVMMFKSFSGHFEAPPDVDKRVILQFITTYIRNKFPDAVAGTGEVFTSLSFTNHEFQNAVDFSVTSQRSVVDLKNSESDVDIIGTIFKDIYDVNPDFGDLWEKADGVAEVPAMLGTAGLVPPASPQFDIPDGTITVGDNTGIGDTSSVPNVLYGVESAGFTVNPPEYPTISQDQINFPYAMYTESYHFMLNRNLKVIPAIGSASSADFIQRTARPTCRIIQIGMARRYNHPPEIPQPAYVNDYTKAFVEKEEIRTTEPKVLADGRGLMYGANWSYVIVAPHIDNLTGAIDPDGFPITEESGLTYVRIPKTPMLTDDSQLYGAVDWDIEAPANDGSFEPPDSSMEGW